MTPRVCVASQLAPSATATRHDQLIAAAATVIFDDLGPLYPAPEVVAQ
jgi:hypothetical protein